MNGVILPDHMSGGCIDAHKIARSFALLGVLTRRDIDSALVIHRSSQDFARSVRRRIPSAPIIRRVTINGPRQASGFGVKTAQESVSEADNHPGGATYFNHQ